MGFCKSCGTEHKEYDSFCGKCGRNLQTSVAQINIPVNQELQWGSGRTCPRCDSKDYEIIAITEGKIKPRGCLSVLVYIILSVVTGGIWILIGLLRSGSRGKIKSRPVGVCRNCGSKFNM